MWSATTATVPAARGWPSRSRRRTSRRPARRRSRLDRLPGRLVFRVPGGVGGGDELADEVDVDHTAVRGERPQDVVGNVARMAGERERVRVGKDHGRSRHAQDVAHRVRR